MLDKRHIARCFNRASDSYDAAATLQRDIGYGLIQRLQGQDVLRQFGVLNRVIDMGAGTGLLAQRLTTLAPEAHYIFVDFAAAMLAQYRACHKDERVSVLCADFESLPVAESTCDLIFASMSLQWSTNLHATLQGWLRCIKKNGFLAIALPVVGTLGELEDCFKRMGHPSHVNFFWSAHLLKGVLQQLPVKLIYDAEQVFYQKGQSAAEVLSTIKKTGAQYKFNNTDFSKKKPWPGKDFLEKLNIYYPKTADNTVIATFNIYYAIMQLAQA